MGYVWTGTLDVGLVIDQDHYDELVANLDLELVARDQAAGAYAGGTAVGAADLAEFQANADLAHDNNACVAQNASDDTVVDAVADATVNADDDTTVQAAQNAGDDVAQDTTAHNPDNTTIDAAKDATVDATHNHTVDADQHNIYCNGEIG